jgi:imidazolonepropionase-like amidohydrolase
MAEHTDTLITHAHLFTLQGEGVGYVADGTVAVKDSRIAAVGSTSELTARFRASETIDASGCAVLPGLIDAHMHTRWAIARRGSGCGPLDAAGAGSLLSSYHPRRGAGWDLAQRPGSAHTGT